MKKLPFIRPSSLPRIDVCPGSLAAEARIQNKGSAEATSGDVIHEALKEWARIPGALKSKQAAESAIEDIAEWKNLEGRELFVFRWFAFVVQEHTEARGGALEIFAEHKDGVDFETFRAEGTKDLLISTPQGLDLWDYKTGNLEQKLSDEHIQVQCYGLMAAAQFEAPGVRIHMLSAGNQAGEHHTYTDYDTRNLYAVEAVIKAIVSDAMEPDAPRNVTKSGCLYCNAAGTLACPESVAAVDKFYGNVIKMDDPIAIFNHQEPAQRAQTLVNAQIVVKVAKKILEAAKAGLVVDPEFIPGFGVGPTQKVREIKSSVKAFNALNSQAGVSIDAFQSICKVSLKDCKGIVHDELVARAKHHGEKKPTKKATEDRTLAMLKGVISFKDKSGQIVEVKDAK